MIGGWRCLNSILNSSMMIAREQILVPLRDDEADDSVSVKDTVFRDLST